MSSTTLNPRTELLLGFAVFSPTKLPGISSNSIDASQPCDNFFLVQTFSGYQRVNDKMLVKLYTYIYKAIMEMQAE